MVGSSGLARSYYFDTQQVDLLDLQTFEHDFLVTRSSGEKDSTSEGTPEMRPLEDESPYLSRIVAKPLPRLARLGWRRGCDG
jgi:hypothetical protein